MSISQNYPTISPSLSMDFALTKKLDPRITFSRPTVGGYYDGKSVAKAEENLVQFSQEFDNAYWSKTGVTISANASVAPDGTSTADDIVDVSGVTVSGLAQSNIAIQNGVQYVYSVYVKAINKTWFDLRFFAGGSGISNYFDITNGVVGTINATSATIT